MLCHRVLTLFCEMSNFAANFSYSTINSEKKFVDNCISSNSQFQIYKKTLDDAGVTKKSTLRQHKISLKQPKVVSTFTNKNICTIS